MQLINYGFKCEKDYDIEDGQKILCSHPCFHKGYRVELIKSQVNKQKGKDKCQHSDSITQPKQTMTPVERMDLILNPPQLRLAAVVVVDCIVVDVDDYVDQGK